MNWWLASLIGLLLASPGERAGTLPSSGADWPVSTPTEQGLDAGRIRTLVEEIREGRRFPDLDSLLIVRRGQLVTEEYFRGWGPDDLHTLQSVSKSVTSALIGIAVQRGEVRLDDKVLDVFAGLEGIENVDGRKAAMTLEHLLTMRSGTDYHESGNDSPHSRLNRLSRGWDRFVLNRPMLRAPGTHFQYDSGAVILMSSILRQRTGLHADEYAARHLFPELGISEWRWSENSEGHPHTGGGLYLRPRDMARFGLLYLQKGVWEGKQVVPASWVEESTRRQVRFQPPRGRSVGYGYLWWVFPPDPDGRGEDDIYAAMGFRAQYIFVVPEHEMVVVVTGGTRSRADQQRPIDFLYSHVLPAVR